MTSHLSLRERSAVWGVRLVNFLSRASGRGAGTVAGGRVGLSMSPSLLDALARSRRVILVSGTNGKTTTTAMIRLGWGSEVASNETGSNMSAGHVAALVTSPCDDVVLEVDEKWLDRTARATRPRVVVLLNLSRDQLDRANEVRSIAEQWRKMGATFDEESKTTVVANVNDPLVVYASELAHDVRWCDVPTTWRGDAAACPACGGALSYVGENWSCTCGFARPRPDVVVRESSVRSHDGIVDVALSIPGQFNVGNAVMAMAALREVGVAMTASAPRIQNIASVAGRYSIRHWRGRELRCQLAKNPAGFAAVLDTIEPGVEVWLCINARIADGRDPSWLYDVPFERLRGHHVVCFGDRRLDLATRLEYAGVTFSLASEESPPSLGTGPVTLIANYTAFQEWIGRSVS